MPIAHSKITAQGQISVPAEVRRNLGVGPGSILEWEKIDDRIVVRRVGEHSLADVRAVLFPEGTPRRKPASTREAIAQAVRKRHARR